MPKNDEKIKAAKLLKAQKAAMQLAVQFENAGDINKSVIAAILGPVPDDLPSLINLRNHSFYAQDHIRKLIDKIQQLTIKKCNHPANKVRYEPDPSGNNDSHYTCTKCSGTFRNNPSND